MDEPSLEIIVAGRKAINSNDALFFYGLYWSKEETWGGDFKPIV